MRARQRLIFWVFVAGEFDRQRYDVRCLWPLTRICVVYVVKEVTSFRGLGQLMGVTRKERALQLQQKLCVAYVETGTNS